MLEKRMSEFSLTLACSRCRHQITSQKQTFVMSSSGVSGKYVNNYGVNHDMITVKKCWNIRFQGLPEKEYRFEKYEN